LVFHDGLNDTKTQVEPKEIQEEMSTDEKIDHIMRKVDKIDRGVYGDPDNGVDGLIKENKDQEKRLFTLELQSQEHEKFRKDLKWWIGKVAAGVSLACGIVWTLIKQRLGI
jgi:hypothetical protein